MPNSIIWVLVSTTSQKEAEKIGRSVLKKRLAACFGIYPRSKSVYFWPPGSNRLEQSKGPLLVLETLPKNVRMVSSVVKKLHSDKVPFVGSLTINNLNPQFLKWMRGEVK